MIRNFDFSGVVEAEVFLFFFNFLLGLFGGKSIIAIYLFFVWFLK